MDRKMDSQLWRWLHRVALQEKMRIAGGSFGVGGTARIDEENRLVVSGVRHADFSGSEMVSAIARTDKEKKFGCLGFVLGALILGTVFGYFLSVLGVVIGVGLAAAGSFYTNTTNLVDIVFSSGEALSLECSPRQIKKLIRMRE